MYDLTVVGGGPAGATCARVAASAGLDVLLLEKAHHPREKPCGGAVGPQGIKELEMDLSSVVERTFNSAVVYTPSGNIVKLTSKDLTGHIVTRSKFDEYLLQQAQDAGANVIQGVEVVGMEQLRAGVRTLVLGDSYKSHILVGADGVNGVIAKELGVRSKWAPDEIAMCMTATVSTSPKDIESVMMKNESDGTPAIELYFGLIRWGYGWCFPKQNEFNIGIGCRADKKESLQEVWERFISRIEREKGLELDVSKKMSYRVPLGGKYGRVIGRRCMLVGDAAGLVSPLTGEGISYAIQSGKLAAKVAIDAVNNKTPLGVVEYDKQLKSTIGKELADMRWIAGILHKSESHTELLFQIAAEDPLMRTYFTNLVSRFSTFSELKVKIAKRMITRHPMKALRLGLKG
ncbi:MAG: geranylgeranyl reductase family protein [Candidatus Thorarchaeota archaeon]